jgi:hypothetical protein
MLSIVLVVLCVVLRVVPHPPNFAPVGAAAVFAGRTLRPSVAIGTVVVAMFVGDAILARVHGYPLIDAETPFVYGGFFFQTWLGRALRSRRGGAVGAAVAGAVGFFVLSNFGVWLTGAMYVHTGAGLAECFVAAIPFFGATLAGDVFWTVALSWAYLALARRFAALPRWGSVSPAELRAV